LRHADADQAGAMKRLPSALLASVAALGLAGAAVAAQKRPPNIIVILADDLGYGDVGAYGGTAFPTPNIDALARSGTLYTDAYATAAVCAPSRAGLLSGRHQARFGFEFNPVGRDELTGMPPAETTFAEIARHRGYVTAMIGKWHIGQAAGFHPLDQGFDSFFGILGGATNYFSDGSSDVQVAETGADGLVTRTRFPVVKGRGIVEPVGNLTDAFADAAVEFVTQNKAKPFLLYVAFNAPHTPLQATATEVAPFAHITSPHQRIYAAMVTTMDTAIGRITAQLRAQGLDRDTIVIFASDNGCPNYIKNACSNGVLAGSKAYPWEGGIRVPFIVSAPGRLPAGRVQSRPISTLDISATVAGLSGAALPATGEGASLLLPPPKDRPLFWRMGPNHSVREGRWKLLVVNKSDTVQDVTNLLGQPVPDGLKATISPLGQWVLLFDLEKDRSEKHDIAAHHPDIVKRLQQRFAEWDKANIDPVFTSRRQFRSEVDGRKVQLFN